MSTGEPLPQLSALLRPAGSIRVVRGSDWAYSVHTLQRAYRAWYTPSGQRVYLGFRLVREAR